MTDDTVFIPARGAGARQTYHTDPDCDRLNRAENIYDKPRSVIDPELEECSLCAGDYHRTDDGYHNGMARHLEELTPEDFGLSPQGAVDGAGGGDA